MNNFFLLGAGFSHAVSSQKAPLTSHLMDAIKDVVPYELEQEFYYYNNIESFITALDLRINNSDLPNIKEVFFSFRQKVVSKIKDILNINKIRDDSCKVGNEFIEAIKQDDIILTLNYDCLIDSLLNDSKKWSPKGGYSPFIGRFPDNSENNQNILLLKLHGSVNFVEAVPFNGRGFDESSRSINVEMEGNVFRNSGIGHLGTIKEAQRGEYIILPTYIKTYHPQIICLWRLAIEKIQPASKLTIIGCSLREEDTALNILLSMFNSNKKDKGEIYIIDKNADIIGNKIKNLCRVDDSSIKKYKGDLKDVLGNYLKDYNK